MKTITHLTGAALIGMALSAQAADFAVSSPDLKPGGTLPTKHVLNGFGCTGGNISPALSWQNAPAGTQSFAITAYDQYRSRHSPNHLLHGGKIIRAFNGFNIEMAVVGF